MNLHLTHSLIENLHEIHGRRGVAAPGCRLFWIRSELRPAELQWQQKEWLKLRLDEGHGERVAEAVRDAATASRISAYCATLEAVPASTASSPAPAADGGRGSRGR